MQKPVRDLLYTEAYTHMQTSIYMEREEGGRELLNTEETVFEKKKIVLSKYVINSGEQQTC